MSHAAIQSLLLATVEGGKFNHFWGRKMRGKTRIGGFVTMTYRNFYLPSSAILFYIILSFFWGWWTCLITKKHFSYVSKAPAIDFSRCLGRPWKTLEPQQAGTWRFRTARSKGPETQKWVSRCFKQDFSCDSDWQMIDLLNEHYSMFNVHERSIGTQARAAHVHMLWCFVHVARVYDS